jgi:signal transduction histidine kinase
MRARVLFPALAVPPAAAVAIAAAGHNGQIADGGSRAVAILVGVAASLAATAVIAERRRPGHPIAPLLSALSVVIPVAAFRNLSEPWLALAGTLAWLGGVLVPAWLFLAFPDGLAGRRRRWPVVVSCALVPAALALGIVISSGARHADGASRAVRPSNWAVGGGPNVLARQVNPIALVSSAVATRTLWLMWSVWLVVVAAATTYTLVKRWLNSDSFERAVHRPMAVVGVLWAATALTNVVVAWPERGVPVAALNPRAHSLVYGRWWSDPAVYAPWLAAVGLAAVLAWLEVLRPRLARSAGGALQLDDFLAGPERLRASLAGALGDPSLALAFHGDTGWVDGQGRPSSVAPRAGRAATVLTRDGAPVAAIEHDASLLAQPDGLDAAAALAALALDNERLHALTLAEVEEVRSSGARMLAAAARARDALEQRLADGPQRRLTEALRLLGDHADADQLTQVHDRLRDALTDVRTISHGLTPIALADEGLAAALEDLAGRTTHALRVRGAPSHRLPAAVEVTVYLVVADAMTKADGGVDVSIAETGDGLEIDLDGSLGAPDAIVEDRVSTLGGTCQPTVGGSRVVLPLPG